MQDKSDNSVKLFSYEEDQPVDGRGLLIPQPSQPKSVVVNRASTSTRTTTSRRGTTRAAVSVFALATLVVLGTSGYGYLSDSSQSASPVVTLLEQEGQGTTFEFGPSQALSRSSLFLETRDTFIDEGLSFIEIDIEARQLRYFEKGVLLMSEEIQEIGEPGSVYEVASGLYEVEKMEEERFSSLSQVNLPWLITFQGNYIIHGTPTNADGQVVGESFALGGISLDTVSAEKLFSLINTDIPILVREAVDNTVDEFVYEPVADAVSATSYLAVDISNGTILAADGIEEVLPIASLVKLMTAVVAAEEIDLDSRIRLASPTFVTSLIPRLAETSTVSMYSLMELLLVESSNEAAETIAGELGREEFVEAMNDKARQLGMMSTNFADPSGLSSDNTSTANDIYTLLKYIVEDRSFIINITAGKKASNIYVGGEFSELTNFNEVEDMASFVGGKVGETNAAGQTSASVHTIKVGGRERQVAIIILGSEQRNADIEQLISSIETQFNN